MDFDARGIADFGVSGADVLLKESEAGFELILEVVFDEDEWT